MGVTVQELSQAINLISNQRLITTSHNHRQLVCELMFKNQINYFFEHNQTMPKSFKRLASKLDDMTKEGIICETIVDKYI